ncbi:MAG: RNA ligase family protein [Halorhodospira halophila]|uniref:RNA ligase family protein n=1 Tax=Halorhodospira halophila TaxID=1053 RepID=UPI0026E97B1F|nr:RNA ligase family protein [Halorhodospira halophila]MCC3751988.1 RNA ligase family protein [Halorhodospira halophila]
MGDALPPKFPRTPHLLWLGATEPRSDKVLSATARDKFLSERIIVEEKVDGANVGVWLDEDDGLVVRNRGTILSAQAHPQFYPLWSWLAQHRPELVQHLGTRYVLYGEWCYAKHSVAYSALPDWFLVIDVYDRQQEVFLSTAQRDALAQQCNLHVVARIGTGRYTEPELLAELEQPSSYGATREGLYLRREQGTTLVERAKLVRAEFLDNIAEHWSRGPLVANGLKNSGSETEVTC